MGLPPSGDGHPQNPLPTMLLPVLLAAVAPVQGVSDPLASEFELVPDRLTIVLEDPSLDAEALLARVASPALAGATILRANRLGNVDIQLAPGADLDLAVDSLAGVATAVVACAAERDRANCHKALVELTEIARRIRLGHRGAV